jgi:predicted dehydrogenase
MKKVRIGVIELGRFGEAHCEALSQMRQTQLYALCTRTVPRLEALARRFSAACAYTDYRELLANPEVDAVSVVTMWDQHAAPAIAALAAGKHVFIEKAHGVHDRRLRRDYRSRARRRAVLHGRTYLPVQSALRRRQAGDRLRRHWEDRLSVGAAQYSGRGKRNRSGQNWADRG